MLHLKNDGYIPKDATDLLVKARKLCSGMDITIRDTRVSSKYVEFDISINKEHLAELVAKLKLIGNLDHAKLIVEEKKEKEDAIKEGIFFFNNERYWECHEVFESVWNNCYGGEKDLIHGIILIAAALVHFQKNEDKICLSILGRALVKLENANGRYHKIDIDGIRNKLTHIRNSGQITTFLI